MKIRLKNVSQNESFFYIVFFQFLLDFASQVEVQKSGDFEVFLKMGPSGAQEAPKRVPSAPKRAPREDFEGFWASFLEVFEAFFCIFLAFILKSKFFLDMLGFRSCMRPVSCASLLSLESRPSHT